MERVDALCKHDVTPSCADASYSTCPHCSLNLCLEHINEHQQLVRLDFDQTIDQINQLRSVANDHSTIDEMKVEVLEQLNTWKTETIDLVTSTYNQERTRVEDAYETCITAKTTTQSQLFEELNAHSKAIEKKKHIHPNDLLPLKQKLNEFGDSVQEIEENIHVELTEIADNVELPQIIELERHLENLAGLKSRVKELEEQINEKDRRILDDANVILGLQTNIVEKDFEFLRTRMNYNYGNKRIA